MRTVRNRLRNPLLARKLAAVVKASGPDPSVIANVLGAAYLNGVKAGADRATYAQLGTFLSKPPGYAEGVKAAVVNQAKVAGFGPLTNLVHNLSTALVLTPQSKHGKLCQNAVTLAYTKGTEYVRNCGGVGGKPGPCPRLASQHEADMLDKLATADRDRHGIRKTQASYRMVPLDKIVFTQDGTHNPVVEAYRKRIRAGENIDAGKDKGTISGDMVGDHVYLDDGHHRVAALAAEGKKHVKVEVRHYTHNMAPNQPRVPAGMPHGGQWTKVGGVGVGSLKFVKKLGGSTGAQLVEDTHGNQYVQKTTNTKLTKDHLQNETDADAAYKALGIPTADSAVATDSTGKVYKLSKFMHGQTLAEWESGKSQAEIEAMHAQIRKGFVADALLANWDAIGLAKDNILIVNGVPHRIDNGGALKYRAQGAPKGAAFGTTVGELDTLLFAGKNAVAASVYKGITKEEMKAQLADILKHEKALLASISDPHTRSIVEARIGYLIGKLGKPADDTFEITAPSTKKVKALIDENMKVGDKLLLDQVKKEVGFHAGAVLADLQKAGIIDTNYHVLKVGATGPVAVQAPTTKPVIAGEHAGHTLFTPKEGEYAGKKMYQIAGWGKAVGVPNNKQAYGALIIRTDPATGKTQVLLREPTNHYQGYVWTFPKGGKEGSETPLQTAKKEVLQETGHDFTPTGHIPVLFDSHGSDPASKGKKNGYFIGVSKGEKPHMMDKETQKLEWFDVDHAHVLLGQTKNEEGKKRDLAILAHLKAQLNGTAAPAPPTVFSPKPAPKPKQPQSAWKPGDPIPVHGMPPLQHKDATPPTPTRSTPQKQPTVTGTGHNLQTGDGLINHLKENGSFTHLTLQKIKFLNPNGIQGGKFIAPTIPVGEENQQQIVKLKSVLPPGTTLKGKYVTKQMMEKHGGAPPVTKTAPTSPPPPTTAKSGYDYVKAAEAVGTKKDKAIGFQHVAAIKSSLGHPADFDEKQMLNDLKAAGYKFKPAAEQAYTNPAPVYKSPTYSSPPPPAPAVAPPQSKLKLKATPSVTYGGFTFHQVEESEMPTAKIKEKLVDVKATLKNLPSTKEFVDKTVHDEWEKSLTWQEKSAIQSWKGSSTGIRKDMIKAFENGTLDKTSQAQHILSAMMKHPPQPGVYYRGLGGQGGKEVAEAAMEALKSGEPYLLDNAAHGTTPNIGIAKGFSSGMTVVRIVSKSARPIWNVGGFNAPDGELEVLQPPNTLYKVKAVHKDVEKTPTGNGKVKYFIDLEEI